MLTRIPLGKGRDLLRDGGEETDNDPNGGRFHIIAELLNDSIILAQEVSTIKGYNKLMVTHRNAVAAVELHHFPDGK